MLKENQLVPYSTSDIPKGPYLVFSPHPDDETLGMGGVIALAAGKGIDIHVVFVTSGGKGGDLKLRTKESEAASEILGVRKRFYLNLPDRGVFSARLKGEQLYEIFKEVSPFTVFLPSFQEFHPDHRAVTFTLLQFLHNTPEISSKYDLWFYEINRQGEVNRLIDISTVLDIKERAVNCYKSQLEQLDYKSHTLCLDFARSVTLGPQVLYVEAFWHYDPGSGMSPENEYFSAVNRYKVNSSEYYASNEVDRVKRELRQVNRNLQSSFTRIRQLSDLSKDLAYCLNKAVHGDESLESLQRHDNKFVNVLIATLEKIHASRIYKALVIYRASDFFRKTAFLVKHFFSVFRAKVSFNSPTAADCSHPGQKHCQDDTIPCLKINENENESESESELEKLSLKLPKGYLPAVKLISSDRDAVVLADNAKQIENIDVFMEIPFFMETGKCITFDIKSNVDNLAGLELLMATCQRINPGLLTVSLFEDLNDNSPMRTSQVPAASLLDNSFIVFPFEPVKGSENTNFIVQLGFTHGIPGKQPALWLFRQCPGALNNNSITNQAYNEWIKNQEAFSIRGMENIKYSIDHFEYRPTISILLYITEHDIQSIPEKDLSVEKIRETLESIQNQVYPFWEMLILFDSQIDEKEMYRWEKYCADTEQITTKQVDEHQMPGDVVNQFLDRSTGEFVLLLCPYDKLAFNAFYEVAALLNRCPDADVIYSDEDQLTMDGERTNPFFKPDWSPDLLWSFMYMGSFSLYRKDLVKIAWRRMSDVFKEHFRYDLALRCSEQAERIMHISKVLYHNRNFQRIPGDEHDSEKGCNTEHKDRINLYESHQPSVLSHQYSANSFHALQCPEGHGCYKEDHIGQKKVGLKKGFNSSAAAQVLKEALKRQGVDGDVQSGLTDNSFRVVRNFKKNTLISIIIPFKDTPEVLGTCIKSILEKTKYEEYEIICVNNQSKKAETFAVMDELNKFSRVSFIDYNKPFNYSAVNNFAVHQARGDLLLFLNSDTEVISQGWLSAMAEHGLRKEVGAVGAKLYYVDDTIQHAGVVLGIAGAAGHAFKGIGRYDHDYYFGMPSMIREVSAVTGACMMVRRSVFEDLKGFDEDNFKISYNDIDFCLKAGQKGYKIIYTPFAQLYHYESYSRGYDFDAGAIDKFIEKWGKMVKDDPFYNKNLTRFKEDWSPGN